MSRVPRRPRPPLFFLLFVSIFGFAGLAVIGFLWSSSGFHEPPLFFKIFGSLIGLAFVLIGFGLPLTALFGRDGAAVNGESAGAPSAGSGGGYQCPNCGSGLGKQEVSPAGDVKCAYCSQWFNIHARS